MPDVRGARKPHADVIPNARGDLMTNTYFQLEALGRYHRDQLLREAEHERLLDSLRSGHQSTGTPTELAHRNHGHWIHLPRLAGQPS
jgi:hypothetical protein